MVRWNRRQPARCLRADTNADGIGSGMHALLALRRFLPVFAILSRRSVRRHNVVCARAFVAIHSDGVASLLP
ncbi:hypothetical protein [Paraburkholderia sp. SOS3]|uniref:hypothetical protein n=1 Tax=Paraburkholderia sp. SOS3 TaxID=1926494 RepID=UPI0009473E24|nr:hypothetical protein BTO02_32000 [Paraburkholderia sp. SOS3]